MKVVTRFIDLMAAFCIEQYCRYFSARQLLVKTDTPATPCTGEKKDAAVGRHPLKLELDKSGRSALPPR
ncbi:hypothetical protein SAMN05216337_1015150 [Bradyrhizobium brasilense]|uniref:Uncharacterized protein n=1 Tax=Bradyrhizobium brasilense TaxID=1419277 RepID=A0A1G6XTC1_9BRAD|nr:hypothetical protein [Bradyrhizobium brasilense]SDD81272.1 hypothetical protein SAMN05216337_1015150 [Bradyrhizobium brasilense]